MKRFIFSLGCLLFCLFSSCTSDSKTAPQKMENQEEVRKIDSVNQSLDRLEKELKAKEKNLDRALEDLSK